VTLSCITPLTWSTSAIIRRVLSSVGAPWDIVCVCVCVFCKRVFETKWECDVIFWIAEGEVVLVVGGWKPFVSMINKQAQSNHNNNNNNRVIFV
jgi:hypothetical protein